jgi:transposase-like protein
MPPGRKPKGPALVDGIDGPAEAKQKLKVILETIAGTKPIAEASGELGIAEAMFHKLRTEWLEGSVKLLEPKPLGRPPKEKAAEADEVERLKEENARLTRDLMASQLKADIALTMPHLLRRSQETGEKKRRSE